MGKTFEVLVNPTTTIQELKQKVHSAGGDHPNA